MLLEMKASDEVAACAVEIAPTACTDSARGTMPRSSNDKSANSEAVRTIIRSFREMVLWIFCVRPVSRLMDARGLRARADPRQHAVQLDGIGYCKVGPQKCAK